MHARHLKPVIYKGSIYMLKEKTFVNRREQCNCFHQPSRQTGHSSSLSAESQNCFASILELPECCFSDVSETLWAVQVDPVSVFLLSVGCPGFWICVDALSCPETIGCSTMRGLN